MNKVTPQQVKKLRELTGAGILETKMALEKAQGDEKKAKVILGKQAQAKAAKREGKATYEGQVAAYVHNGGRVGAMVKLMCETDFVGRSPEFLGLAKELAMQVASMEPKNIKQLLKQAYIRDSKQTVNDLLIKQAAKFKEKIEVKEIVRLML